MSGIARGGETHSIYLGGLPKFRHLVWFFVLACCAVGEVVFPFQQCATTSTGAVQERASTTREGCPSFGFSLFALLRSAVESVGNLPSRVPFQKKAPKALQ